MITLPPKTDNTAPEVLDDNIRRLVVIGANGAGKTRFTTALAASLGRAAVRLNAVEAIYASSTASAETGGTLDRMFLDFPAIPAHEKTRRQTRLERLLTMLMTDELTQLLNSKFAGTPGQATRLDAIVDFWQEVFPNNRVHMQAGQLMFGRDDSADIFNAVRLSDGERAALFYVTAVLYAPQDAVILVDSPEIFLHPATIQSIWNRLEAMRPDCVFTYSTHDLEFAASRLDALFIWVRSSDPANGTFDYQIIPDSSGLTTDVTLAIMGARKPVLFIEGDHHSIDARLYPLIFPDCTVKSLGSCNKVIEATRTFNDLNGFHHLSACGIVDRDRRDDGEIAYLRRKNVMVPDVAEIENMLLLEDVVTAMATWRHKNPERVMAHVRKAVMGMFGGDLRQQALQHTRHRVKRTMEYRIDGRFRDIGALEDHILDLARDVNPRALYEQLCRDFHGYIHAGDYNSVLRVYNQKSMLPGSNVASLCGYRNADEYIQGIMTLLTAEPDSAPARQIRQSIRTALRTNP